MRCTAVWRTVMPCGLLLLLGCYLPPSNGRLTPPTAEPGLLPRLKAAITATPMPESPGQPSLFMPPPPATPTVQRAVPPSSGNPPAPTSSAGTHLVSATTPAPAPPPPAPPPVAPPPTPPPPAPPPHPAAVQQAYAPPAPSMVQQAYAQPAPAPQPVQPATPAVQPYLAAPPPTAPGSTTLPTPTPGHSGPVLPPPTPVSPNSQAAASPVAPGMAAATPPGIMPTPGQPTAPCPPGANPGSGLLPTGGLPLTPGMPGSVLDQHQRSTPTAMGSVLQLPPNQSPIEKALELSMKVEAMRLENNTFNQRLKALEDGIQTRDRLLNTAARDIQDASAEVARVRRDLQTWVEELKQQQARIRQLDKDYQELLRTVIRMLEKAVGPEGANKQPAGES